MNFIFCFFLFCSFFSHALPSFIDYDSVVVVVLRLEIRAIDFHCSVEFYCLVFSFFLRFFPFFLGYFLGFFLREMRRFLSGNRLEVCEGFHGTSSIVCWIFFLRFFFKFRSAAFFFVLFFFLCGISHEPARPPVLAILARPKRPNQLKF